MVTRYRVTLLTDEGERVFATHRIFPTMQAAREYAAGCAQSRLPEIINVLSNIAPEFLPLRNVKLSDNCGMVGWSCIHAWGWNVDSLRHALYLAPSGSWTPTVFIGSDDRRSWGSKEAEECEEFGNPVVVLARGAYFNFPYGTEAARLLSALDMNNHLLRLMAGGGRFPWPRTVMGASFYT